MAGSMRSKDIFQFCINCWRNLNFTEIPAIAGDLLSLDTATIGLKAKTTMSVKINLSLNKY